MYADAVILTDHHSDVICTHLIKSTSTDDTLYAKRSFKRVVKATDVLKMKHYHVDNLRFNEK